MLTIYLFPLVCCWISMHSWWEPISFMWEHFATNVFLLSNKYSPLCEQYFHINHWTHLHNCFLFAAFIIFIGQKWTWNPCHEAFAPQAGSNYLPCGLDQWHTWNKSGKAGKARDHKEQPTSVKGTRVILGHIQIYLSLKYFLLMSLEWLFRLNLQQKHLSWGNQTKSGHGNDPQWLLSRCSGGLSCLAPPQNLKK